MASLVSIIVLTYNSERYISNCLEAIKNQTYKSFEVLIVDAGSTDETIKILEKYKSLIDLQVILAPNTSMGEARNIGVRRASGEFLAFCDSDDVFLPEKLNSQLESARNTSCDKFVVFSNHLIAKEGEFANTRVPRDNTNFMKKKSYEVLVWQGCNLSGMLVRHFKDTPIFFTSGLGGRYGEDWQYNISLYMNDYEFVHCDGIFSSVTERPDSHTTLEMQYLLVYYVLLKVFSAKDYLKKKGHSKLTCYRILVPFIMKFYLSSAFVIDKEDYKEKLALLQKEAIFKKLFFIRFLIWPLLNKRVLLLLLKLKRMFMKKRL